MSGSQLGVSPDASLFFVLTLDIPFNVVFYAPAPLTLPLRSSTPPSDSVRHVAPINSSPARSTSRVESHVRRRVGDRTVTCHRHHRDVSMSRDYTPEAAAGRVVERGCRASQSQDINGRAGLELRASVGRHEILSRPRSRSVCSGKYCSVGGLRSSPAVCWSARGRAGAPSRPHSASNTRHVTAAAVNSFTHRQLLAAATRRFYVAKHQVNSDVTVDDNDDTGTTSSSVLGDSGVMSSVNDDVITSRDTSPWSDGSEERVSGGERRGMIETDRQSQLRRFLDAVRQRQSSSSDRHSQQQASEAHNDVSDDDDDDDDDIDENVSETETRRASVNEVSDWQVGEHNRLVDISASAMDQVRQLVNRCRLPIYPSTQASDDALQRLDTCTRTIKQHSNHQSSMTSESIQRAVLGAAADLVRARLLFGMRIFNQQKISTINILFNDCNFF